MNSKIFDLFEKYDFPFVTLVAIALLFASDAWAQKIVYDSANLVGESDIYVVDLAGGSPANLTNSDTIDSRPQWSPDGMRIAYTYRDGFDWGISVMNADGSNQTILTKNSTADIDPIWSPDGTKILFERRVSSNTDLYLINADGSGLTRLTDAEGSDEEATWSPDGSKILFRSRRDGSGNNAELYVMNADGSGQTNLTNHPNTDSEGQFSPDGSRIAFTTTRNSFRGEIYVMNADGSDPVNLTNHPESDTTPRWSPDGTKILFNSRRDGNQLDLFVMNADGSHQQNLTGPNDSLDYQGLWTADGRILFVSQLAGSSQIFVMNVDGSNQTNITNSNRFDADPHPSDVVPSEATPIISSGGIVMANLLPTVGVISPLSIISVFGQNFSADTIFFPDLDVNGNLATVLGGTCLLMNGLPAPIFAVTPGQINAQVLANQGLGPASFTVVTNCGSANALSSKTATVEPRQISPTPRDLTSDAEMVTVEEATPSFFLFPPRAEDGFIAARFNATEVQAPVPVAPTNLFPNDSFGPSRPAVPGDVILLYGTGWGETTAGLQAGELATGAARLLEAANPMVTFGGIPMASNEVIYVGATPETAGLYQLAIRVPGTAMPGNHQVILTVYGKSTPTGPVIPVALP